MGEDEKAKWVFAGVATVCAKGVVITAIMTSTPIDVSYKSLFKVKIGKATAGPSNDSSRS